MVKVFVVNGSPRAEKGNTAVILGPFLEGMKEAGASVELFYTARLKIKPCTGDFKCWWETIGECYIKDDMQALYPKLREAEILVIATPVYIPLPGGIQNFINRLCPIVEPLLETLEGRTRAKFHDDVKIRKIVLVSTSGWWELGNFGTVVRIAEELATTSGVGLAGPVLRPHAHRLRRGDQESKEVLEASRLAGYQLAKDGTIPEETLSAISRPLISEDEFRTRSNQSYLEAKNG